MSYGPEIFQLHLFIQMLILYVFNTIRFEVPDPPFAGELIKG
jgi:hypothetical protein